MAKGAVHVLQGFTNVEKEASCCIIILQAIGFDPLATVVVGLFVMALSSITGRPASSPMQPCQILTWQALKNQSYQPPTPQHVNIRAIQLLATHKQVHKSFVDVCLFRPVVNIDREKATLPFRWRSSAMQISISARFYDLPKAERRPTYLHVFLWHSRQGLLYLIAGY